MYWSKPGEPWDNELLVGEKERPIGIEPTSPAWKAGVITIIRRTLAGLMYTEMKYFCQQGFENCVALYPNTLG